MRRALIKQFVRKAVIKTIIFAVIISIVLSIGQSLSPIISNTLGLTQMQNSNEMYVLMNTYNNVRSIINVLCVVVIPMLFVYTIGRDTYKLIKTINVEKEKEN